MKLTLKPLVFMMAGAAVMFITLASLPQARTTAQSAQPSTSQSSTSSSSTSSTSSTSSSITDIFSQISSIIDGIDDFVANISGVVSDTLSSALGDFGVPDLATVLDQLKTTSTSSDEGAMLSEALENRQSENGNGSFAIRSDLANQASRKTAIAVMNSATLGQEAQERMVQQAQIAQQAVEENAQLAEESQTLDVTQHIMQNLSQQSALSARVNQQILQEAQQARLDRSISNTLSAQIAEEVSAANIADRRQKIGTVNKAVQQTGLFSLPGGYYLGDNN